MRKKNFNGQNSVATSALIQEEIKRSLIEQEISSGYNKIKKIKFAGHPMYWFDLENGIRVWIEKEDSMWQVSVTRNWNSFKDPGEDLLDRRAFNLDENHKTMRWSNKVIDRAVELIVEAIA